jgi:histidinol-phosphatase
MYKKGIEMRETLQPYFDFITETAYLAGRLTLGYFQTGVAVDLKTDNSPVTLADRLAEELIRSRIENRFPTHAIIGEEEGEKEIAGATHRWFIDPIDGTKSFMRGVPLYGVLIGLEIEGRVEVGAAYFPALGEMVAAATGLGCWLNGRRACVSSVTNLKQAFLSCTDPGSFRKNGRGEPFERLAQAVYFRPGWGDAYGYACVAVGRAEIMLDPVMNVWDCGPFPAIFREAGGYFGDWQGNETIYSCEALATNPALLPEILKLLND